MICLCKLCDLTICFISTSCRFASVRRAVPTVRNRSVENCDAPLSTLRLWNWICRQLITSGVFTAKLASRGHRLAAARQPYQRRNNICCWSIITKEYKWPRSYPYSLLSRHAGPPTVCGGNVKIASKQRRSRNNELMLGLGLELGSGLDLVFM